MYSIEFTTTAEKDILRLPNPIHERVEYVVDQFQSDPRPVHCKKLKGLPNVRRVQIGDYRISYNINEKQKHITIYRILHRKDAYR